MSKAESQDLQITDKKSMIDINDLPAHERHNKLRTVNFQMLNLNAYLHTHIKTVGSTLIKNAPACADM
jgi:hypothetical protein